MARRAFFESSWGNVRLWLSRLSGDQGRSVIVQQYTRGNQPDVRAKGNVPDIVRCALLFDDLTGATEDPIARFEALVALKNKGQPQLFVHPMFGAYLAEISELTYEIESGGTISAEASFVAVEEANTFSDPIGVSLDASTGAIDARVADLQAQLATAELASEMPGRALAARDAFDNAETTTRDALVQVAGVSDRLWNEIDAFKVAADIELWPLMKSYVMLGDAVRATADDSIGGPAAYMTIRVDGPTSLRRLVADVYGGDQAQARYDEAMELNDLRTPGRIAAGTKLRLRQPSG